MRKKITLSKVYIKKIDKLTDSLNISDKEQFKQQFIDHMKYELRVLKDCSEKSIVTNYLSTYNEFAQLNDRNIQFNDYLDQAKHKVRSRLAEIYAKCTDTDNLMAVYFNEIKKEYIMHPIQEQEEVEFNDENREIFLKNNLKLVIDVAKRYTGLGLPFEDLVSAGNVGLCIAFERYDKNRANLRIAILKDINKIEVEPISYEDAKQLVSRNFLYAKNLESTISKLPQEGFECKQDFIDWAYKHIKTAVFSSIAFQWIRANILQEISKYSKVLRVPKLTTEDKPSSTIIVNLDAVNTHTNDCYHDNQISDVSNENFMIEDQSIENNNKQVVLNELIDNILSRNLTSLEKRVLKKSFGVGYPYQLNTLEIAENEGLSANKVKYMLKIALGKVTNGLSDKEMKILKDILYN